MRFKSLNNHGYTLIEIIIVIVILGVIGGFTFQMVAAGVQAFKMSSARKDLYDQGRLALERMVRELRDAKEIGGSSSSSITFKKAHPAQAADYTEEIKFQLNGNNLERVGNPSGTPVTAVLASNVSGFTVTGAAGGGGTGTCSIASDSQSSSYADGVSSLSFSHTIGGGSNRVLVVGVSIETCNPYQTVSSINYGGKTLTPLNSAQVTSPNGCMGRVELYYLLEADMPGAGAFHVVVTATGWCDALAAGAISLTGVAQQAPEASNTNSNDAQTSISTNITTLTNGAWLVDVVHSGNPYTFTANSGQSIRYDQATSTSEVAGSTRLVATAGTVSQGWTNASANRLAHAVAAFAPATGCITGGGGGSIILDNVTDRYNSGTGNFAHAIGSGSGNNRLLVVCYGQEANSTVNSMSYNGVAMTKIHREYNPDGAINVTEMWYILDSDMPSSAGTYDVSMSVTGGNGPGIVVLSFEGVEQQPQETYNSSQYASGANDRSTTQLQNVSAGSLVISVVCNGSSGGYDGNVGGAGGAGIRQSEGDPSSAGMGVSTDLSSTGGTFNVVEISELSPSTTNRATHIVAAFAAAASSLVTLELTLSSSEGGTVSMRTKVFLRNMP